MSKNQNNNNSKLMELKETIGYPNDLWKLKFGVFFYCTLA